MKKLLKLAFIAVAVAFAAKLIEAKKAEWEGMAESDVRAKLDARLPEKVPAEKRSEIANKVVGMMRDQGVLREDAPAAEATDTDEGALPKDAPASEESASD
jgi:hypothetical protein